MENMVGYRFNNIYKDKKVLVTGHTGFKGSWLCVWLELLGAKVIGYSLPPNSNPNHFELLRFSNLTSVFGDINDYNKLKNIIDKHEPDIVFHLAAQPLVRYSYSHPVKTFQTNIMGVVNLLQISKSSNSIKAVVNITSDKCYENLNTPHRYSEDDKLGGYDPYSASKACAEIVSASYRDSFMKDKNILLASCRAGNVIGGGDWAEDRLIPDIIRSIASNKKLTIRQPNATRPWQHVLDPLSGYLLLGQKLLEGKKEYARSWNFGPHNEKGISVKTIVEQLKEMWPAFEYEIQQDDTLHEANFLELDCSLARAKLKWNSTYTTQEALKQTIEWYKSFYANGNISTKEQIQKFMQG